MISTAALIAKKFAGLVERWRAFLQAHGEHRTVQGPEPGVQDPTAARTRLRAQAGDAEHNISFSADCISGPLLALEEIIILHS